MSVFVGTVILLVPSVTTRVFVLTFMSVNFVLSDPVIICPDPEFVISASSVALCKERSVTSVGLFKISESPVVAL